MKKYILDLFEYNNWANDKIILKLQSLRNKFKDNDPFKILSHIISSQDRWFERLKNKPSYNIDLWEVYSIQEIEILSLNSSTEWKKFISKINAKNFETTCTYKNTKGKELSNTYQDIFQHVINHSTYHRGQINQILRNNNIQPVITDFIYYC